MHTPYDTSLPPHLRALKEEIEGYAREYGLDFYETIFEVIDADDLNEVAAYGGFPTRYPHWSFGMSYEELRKGYDYGLSKIYEMVINNDPCYAYLMRSNHTVDQKLVMAHVYGHCDFFKNNAYFGHTNRKMMDEMANHGARIRAYVEKYGEDEVEAFLDRCMSIDDLIDIHSTAIRRREEVSRYDFTPDTEEKEDVRATRFKSKDYMEDYINPRDILKAEEDERRKRKEQASRRFPEHPEKDVLLFLIEHAPLKPWQRDILSIVRDEAYYFAPQGQTKVINEGWACLTAGSRVLTSEGVLPIEDLVGRRSGACVSDGQGRRQVSDWARFPDRETVRVRTRRGLELEGSVTHQLWLPDGSWRRLDGLQVGDRIRLAVGTDLWAARPVRLSWQAPVAGASEAVARANPGRHAAVVAQGRQEVIRVPSRVDETFAAFLGYVCGDGHISARERTIALLTGVDTLADHFARLTEELFGLTPIRRRQGKEWSVSFRSSAALDLLKSLGLPAGNASIEDIPEVILRSPKPVVAAFLRAYYDCNGSAGPAGAVLSPATEALGRTVQILLLNFGVLSTRRPAKAGGGHLAVPGGSAARFLEQIGFGQRRKQQALEAYVRERGPFKEEAWEDEVVALGRRRADVYDISVVETHRYVAQGLINHNSYWHSTIMTQKAMAPSEVIDYADHHSGTMAMSRTRLNPYKLGIELLRDIEHRWNTGKFGKEYEECDDLEKRRTWDKQLGLGRKKIFEVRRVHNDITFIDTFLTPEFCVQHNLFSFAYQEQGGQYVIESRDFEKIKQRLLFSLTNFGKPWIYVVDGNYRNRGELLLQHRHTGVELRLDQAADTLANIQSIWSRPVHLQTLVDGKPTTLSFDGTDHAIRTGGDNEDPRRNTPAKTR